MRLFIGDGVKKEELEGSRRSCIEHVLRVCKQLAHRYLELKSNNHLNASLAPANETRLAKLTLWSEQIRMSYDSVDLLNEVQHFLAGEAIRRTYNIVQATLIPNADYFVQNCTKG